MSFNDGAEIVPLEVVQAILIEKAGIAAIIPENYARAYLLSGYGNLVSKAWDSSTLTYGSLAPDWPLCADFAEMCLNAVRLLAYTIGIAIRPCFGVLYYTKNSGQRHAINWAVSVSRDVLFFEPQTGEWLGAPKDCLTMDEFRL